MGSCLTAFCKQKKKDPSTKYLVNNESKLVTNEAKPKK